MNTLRHFILTCPWWLACALTLGAAGTLALFLAWLLERSEPNQREARLARKRRRLSRRVALRKPADNVYRHAFREHKR